MTGPLTRPTMIGKLSIMDDEAWREFVVVYGPIAYRLAKKKGLDREAAEEIVQRVCCKMVGWLPTFQYDPARGRFRKLVLTFALTEIRDYFKQLGRRPRQLPQNYDVPDEAWWDSAESVRLLQMACEKLRPTVTERDYAVFHRLVFDEARPTEVASEFNISRNLVDGIKYKMLRKLRETASEQKEAWDAR